MSKTAGYTEFDNEIVAIELSLEKGKLACYSLLEDYLQSTMKGYLEFAQSKAITQCDIVYDYLLKAYEELAELRKRLSEREALNKSKGDKLATK
jgi:hypothetical protein